MANSFLSNKDIFLKPLLEINASKFICTIFVRVFCMN